MEILSHESGKKWMMMVFRSFNPTAFCSFLWCVKLQWCNVNSFSRIWDGGGDGTSRNDVSPYKCSGTPKLIVPRTQCPLDWYIPWHFDHIYVLPHAHNVRGMYQSRDIVFRDGVIYRTRILIRGHIVSGRPVTPLVHKFGSLFSTHYRYCLMKKNGDSCLVSFDWYWFNFRNIISMFYRTPAL